MPIVPERRSGHKRKIYTGKWPEIVERYRSGEQIQLLAGEFGVSTGTLTKHLREEPARYDHRGNSPKIRDVNLKEFAAKARSILWRTEDDNTKHPLYYAWKTRVQELRDRHGCSYGAAVVQASKEVRCLWKLFREYNVEQFDKWPDAIPEATRYAQQRRNEESVQKVRSEEIEQSYKQNLAWAIAAAGEYQRTGVEIKSCPNDAAFFLYKQALDSPKDFLARFSTAEAKSGDKDESDRLTARRADDEIGAMLSTILDDDAEEGEAMSRGLA